jgi:hypothetical protein
VWWILAMGLADLLGIADLQIEKYVESLLFVSLKKLCTSTLGYYTYAVIKGKG